MPLLICPDCGSKVSSNAPACPKCGRPRVKDGTHEGWKKDGITPGSIVGGLVFLGLMFAGVRACNDWLDRGPELVERNNQIVAGTVQIPAEQVVYYKLDIKSNFQNAHAKGKFTAAGGSGNDIYAFVSDETDVINWKNGHKSKVDWQTDGEQTTGSFDVPLNPGVVYYLVLSNETLSNAAPVVSDKQVTIDATLTFKESVAKTSAPGT